MDRLKRMVFPALLALAAYWAVFGGTYSIFDVRRTRATTRAEAAGLEALQRENAALESRSDALESDSAALERIARERFGMIRDDEVLYRFAEPDVPDSAAVDSVAQR